MSVFSKKSNTNPSHSQSYDKGKDSFFGIQAKLNIGKSNDKYEVEADRVADKVVSNNQKTNSDSFFSPNPIIQSKPAKDVQRKDKSEETEEIQEKPLVESITPVVQLQPIEEEKIQKKCAECEAEEKNKIQTKKENNLQTKASNDVSAESNSNLESKLNSSKGGGSSLSGNVKSEMESGFGTDFSNVRIHNDSTAVQMNKELGSQAFATGNNIYFNEGKYNPNSQEGKHLLAHELTHTLQQGASTNLRTKKYPTLNNLGNHVRFLQKSSDDNQEKITQFYKTGDSAVIQQFNPFDIINSLTDISEYLNITLPEGPIEALELLISTMENEPVRLVLSALPGYTAALLLLKSTLGIIKAIEYILNNKEKIIQEIMDYIEEKLDNVQEIVREKLEDVLGILDDRHFSIIWNVHMLPMLTHLKDNWQETVKNAIWEQIWPFEGLTSILNPEPVGLGKNLVAIWSHLSGAFSNFNNLELSKGLDDILMLGKEVTALVNRFYGWVAIVIIASATVVGAGGIGAITAGTGTVAGAAAGFGAGLVTAGTIGEFLLGFTIGIDLLIILKSILSLNAVDSMLVDEEKMRENNIYYGRIAQSTISTGLMIALLALAYLAGAIAGAILSKVTKFLPKGVLEIIDHIKLGMKGERPGNGELEPPNVRETPPELEVEFNTLREKVNNPENIRTVSDSELATKYDVEVSVGEHTYRRRIADGKWCRFSMAVCGLEIDGVNVKVDENLPEPVVDVAIEIQVGEELTVPIQGARRARVVSIKREVIQGREFTMYELRIAKDSRTGFETGSTQRVTDVTLREWFAEGRAIRWTQERSRLMRSRPEYREGLVNEVWEASKSPDGKVRDPHDSSIELHWDRNRSRYDQWHMGHRPGHEYNKLVDRYVDGQISWDQFIAEYNNPNFYHAEDPIGNMGHGNEAP
jgi:hypothetical protein